MAAGAFSLPQYCPLFFLLLQIIYVTIKQIYKIYYGLIVIFTFVQKKENILHMLLVYQYIVSAWIYKMFYK